MPTVGMRVVWLDWMMAEKKVQMTEYWKVTLKDNHLAAQRAQNLADLTAHWTAVR